MTQPHDFTSLIANAVAARMTPEFIEKEIDTRVEKLVIESIDSSLRRYSGAGELIQKAVQEALRVDRIDLPSYGSTVAAMVKRQVELRVAEVVAGRLAADMDDLLKLAPKEIKLSEIADGMRERQNDPFIGERGRGISVVVEHSEYGGGFVYIGLDQREADKRRRRDCEYEIGLDKEGKVFTATLEGRSLDSTAVLGRRFGLDQLIRAWYACGTRIIVDEDAVVTCDGDY